VTTFATPRQQREREKEKERKKERERRDERESKRKKEREKDRARQRFQLKILRPQYPNQETKIPSYKFKLNQNLGLNLYHEIPRLTEFLKLGNFGV